MIYSRTSEYAIRALGFIALEAQPSGIGQVSRKIGAPPAYVSKIFQGLVHAKILYSRRGAKGGYFLRVDPARLKLITIVKAIDNLSQSPFSGCVMGFSQCGSKCPCPLHKVWAKSKKQMEKKLNTVTLLEIIKRTGQRKQSKRKRITLSKRMRHVFGRAGLLAGLIFLFAANPQIARAHTFPLFTEKCSSCHTIGEGKLVGPDLLPVQKWPLSKISENVRRMENYVGELSTKEVEYLSRFLKNPHAGGKGIIKGKEKEKEKETEAGSEPASESTGKEFFWGTTPFANGGLACFACHKVGLQGGTLGPDLTNIYESMGAGGLMASLQNINFRIMRPVYKEHPLTKQEAIHLTKFFESLKGSQQATHGVFSFHQIGTLLAVLFLGGMIFIYRRRRL